MRRASVRGGAFGAASIAGRRRAWTPRDIPSLIGWYRADNVVLTSGKVSQWTDLGPNGLHLAQASGALQPSPVANVVNGQPVVRFAGAQSMSVAFGSRAQPNTIALVVKLASQAGTPMIIDGPASHRNLIYCNTASTVALNGGAAQFATTQSLTAAFVVLTAVFNNASSALRINGAQVGTGDASDQALTGLFVGSDGGLSTFMSGDIADVVPVSGLMTATDLLRLEGYLRQKYATA